MMRTRHSRSCPIDSHTSHASQSAPPGAASAAASVKTLPSVVVSASASMWPRMEPRYSNRHSAYSSSSWCSSSAGKGRSAAAAICCAWHVRSSSASSATAIVPGIFCDSWKSDKTPWNMMEKNSIRGNESVEVTDSGTMPTKPAVSRQARNAMSRAQSGSVSMMSS